MFISISTKRDVALVLGVANFLCNHRDVLYSIRYVPGMIPGISTTY